jgi:hypothetical protein
MTTYLHQNYFFLFSICFIDFFSLYMYHTCDLEKVYRETITHKNLFVSFHHNLLLIQPKLLTLLFFSSRDYYYIIVAKYWCFIFVAIAIVFDSKK